MKTPNRLKTIGLSLIILSISGLVFSLAGIIATWALKPRLQRGVYETLSIAQDTLTTTNNGIAVLESAIDNSKSNLDIIQTSLESLGTTLESVADSLETSGTLVGDDLRLILIETQVALSSAASSAEIIDDTLGLIAMIPYIGADYQPDVPLHISLGQVADRLDDLPDSFETMEANLSDSAVGVSTFSEDLSRLTENVGGFSDDLSDSQSVLMDYEAVLKRTSGKIDSLQRNLGKYATLLSLILSGVLLWLGVAQSAVLLQGLAFWRNDQKVVTLADLERE